MNVYTFVMMSFYYVHEYVTMWVCVYVCDYAWNYYSYVKAVLLIKAPNIRHKSIISQKLWVIYSFIYLILFISISFNLVDRLVGYEACQQLGWLFNAEVRFTVKLSIYIHYKNV